MLELMGPTSGAQSISPAPHLTLGTRYPEEPGVLLGAQRLQSEASCHPLPTSLLSAPSLLSGAFTSRGVLSGVR